eukprot:7119664-Prymnesium_polylepis.1
MGNSTFKLGRVWWRFRARGAAVVELHVSARRGLQRRPRSCSGGNRTAIRSANGSAALQSWSVRAAAAWRDHAAAAGSVRAAVTCSSSGASAIGGAARSAARSISAPAHLGSQRGS